jgi:hypothetical protein
VKMILSFMYFYFILFYLLVDLVANCNNITNAAVLKIPRKRGVDGKFQVKVRRLRGGLAGLGVVRRFSPTHSTV